MNPQGIKEMRKSKKFFVGLLATLVVATGISNTTIVKAAEKSNTNQIVLSTENITNDSVISQTVVDSKGNEGILEITEVATPERKSVRTWKVSYTSGVINCHFYMKVSNNKCISAYNKKIMTIGCSYSNDKLAKISTYARLSMNITTLLDLVKFNGCLQGKVTGKNNDIKVTYNF